MSEKIFIVGTPHLIEGTARLLNEKKDTVFVSYSKLFSGNSKIATDAKVYFSFPYELWLKMVEVKDVLYGCEGYGAAIHNLSTVLSDQLDKRFPGAYYVNEPGSILLERDKKLTKEIVRNAGLHIPSSVPKNMDAILESIHLSESVYVKARFGSMGKGISYFSEKKWTTNFDYDKKKGIIKNHVDDKNWPEQDITGDLDFLKKILEHDVVVEKAIMNPATNGIRFDLRIHSIYDVTLPELSYARLTKGSSITNISQGGSYVSFKDMIKYVPEDSLNQSLTLIKHAAKSIGFNYSGGDVLFQGKEFTPTFLEINSFPGLSTQPEKFKRNVIDKLYEGIKKGDDFERTNYKSRN